MAVNSNLRHARPDVTLVLVPSMALLSPEIVRVLRRDGAQLVINPLAGEPVATRAAKLRQALTPVAGQPGVVVQPAQGLEPLGPLAGVLADVPLPGILRLDVTDILRTILRPLRAEAWRNTRAADGSPNKGAIPPGHEFRATIDLQRLPRQALTLQTGRTILDAACAGLAVRVLWPERATAEEWAALGLDMPQPEGMPPLEALLSDPVAVLEVARLHRIAGRDVTLPAPPAPRPDGARLMAFCCGRNVRDYLPVLARRMAAESVPLVYIDNGSDDDSAGVARSLLGHGITEIHHLPYSGSFSMRAQLEFKESLIRQHGPRWVLNIDADELITHRDAGRGLLDIASEAEAHGYNAVNFDEFVFLPEPGVGYRGHDFGREMRRCYFHAPKPFRLIRMWRHGEGLSNVESSGHQLSGPMRLSPVNHDLRHYIVLDQQMALDKYHNRVYAQEEIARNWHGNRLGITAGALTFPAVGDARLQIVDGPSASLSRAHPQAGHWWMWS